MLRRCKLLVADITGGTAFSRHHTAPGHDEDHDAESDDDVPRHPFGDYDASQPMPS